MSAIDRFVSDANRAAFIEDPEKYPPPMAVIAPMVSILAASSTSTRMLVESPMTGCTCF